MAADAFRPASLTPAALATLSAQQHRHHQLGRPPSAGHSSANGAAAGGGARPAAHQSSHNGSAAPSLPRGSQGPSSTASGSVSAAFAAATQQPQGRVGPPGRNAAAAALPTMGNVREVLQGLLGGQGQGNVSQLMQQLEAGLASQALRQHGVDGKAGEIGAVKVGTATLPYMCAPLHTRLHTILWYTFACLSFFCVLPPKLCIQQTTCLRKSEAGPTCPP